MKRAAGCPAKSTSSKEFIRRAPGIGLMMGYRVRDAEDVLLKVVLHLPANQGHVCECDSNVIAVGNPLRRWARLSVRLP